MIVKVTFHAVEDEEIITYLQGKIERGASASRVVKNALHKLIGVESAKSDTAEGPLTPFQSSDDDNDLAANLTALF